MYCSNGHYDVGLQSESDHKYISVSTKVLEEKYLRKSISKQLYQESPIAFQYGVDVPHRYSIN